MCFSSVINRSFVSSVCLYKTIYISLSSPKFRMISTAQMFRVTVCQQHIMVEPKEISMGTVLIAGAVEDVSEQ